MYHCLRTIYEDVCMSGCVVELILNLGIRCRFTLECIVNRAFRRAPGRCREQKISVSASLIESRFHPPPVQPKCSHIVLMFSSPCVIIMLFIYQLFGSTTNVLAVLHQTLAIPLRDEHYTTQDSCGIYIITRP